MLCRQKYLCALFIAMMFFVIVFSGCGGGSSSNIGTPQGNEEKNDKGWDTDPNDNDNNNTPQKPDEPSNPDKPQEPEPEEPESEYDIDMLQGKWTASNGTGTATGNGRTFNLRMIHVNASFSNVQTRGSTVTAIASTSAEWDIYLNGTYNTTTYSDYNRETITIRHIGTDTWRYSFPDNNNTVTVNLTSETTASVVEEGTTSEGYQYTARYTIKKDNPDSPALKYDTGRLQGTWSASNGGGTASGNGESFELRLSSASSVSVSNLQASGDNLTGSLSGIIGWNAYLNGTRIWRVGLEYSKLEVHHISGNTWRTNNGKSTMTLTSQTTASIIEKGTVDIEGKTYNYFIAFSMEKQ